jgi:hypothetical protein
MKVAAWDNHAICAFWAPLPLTFECLHEFSWNFVCTSRHQGPPHQCTSLIPKSSAILFVGDINTGIWSSRLWGHKNRENKIWSWVLRDSDPRERALARPSNNWKLQTLPLVRGGTPHQQTSNCLKIIFKLRKNWLWVPDGVPDTKTDWPTDSRS